MRKVYLISVLFLLITISSAGQKIRFTDSTNTWRGAHATVDYPLPATVTPFYYAFGQHMTVNNKTYQALGGAWVREDTVMNKVFVLRNDTDDVLMDYNWQIGDTIFRDTDNYHFATLIFAMDSTQINGLWYKVWLLHSLLGPYYSTTGYYSIIEGVGSLGGPLYLLFPYSFETYDELYCFSNKNINPTVSPPIDYFDNASSCDLNVKPQAARYQQSHVVPNPATEESKIMFSHRVSSATLYIFNSSGQTIKKVLVSNKDEYSIGSLPVTGLYFYRLFDYGTGNSASGGFLYK